MHGPPYTYAACARGQAKLTGTEGHLRGPKGAGMAGMPGPLCRSCRPGPALTELPSSLSPPRGAGLAA